MFNISWRVYTQNIDGFCSAVLMIWTYITKYFNHSKIKNKPNPKLKLDKVHELIISIRKGPTLKKKSSQLSNWILFWFSPSESALYSIRVQKTVSLCAVQLYTLNYSKEIRNITEPISCTTCRPKFNINFFVCCTALYITVK
jgi:hypothetical protein